MGDGDFCKEVLSEMDDRSKEGLQLTAKGMDVVSLAKRVCEGDTASLGELRSGGPEARNRGSTLGIFLACSQGVGGIQVQPLPAILG